MQSHDRTITYREKDNLTPRKLRHTTIHIIPRETVTQPNKKIIHRPIRVLSLQIHTRKCKPAIINSSSLLVYDCWTYLITQGPNPICSITPMILGYERLNSSHIAPNQITERKKLTKDTCRMISSLML